MQIAKRRKLIAAFFLFIFSTQLLVPVASHALTNGPSQPEMAKFEPAGTSDLVDLFTGDMKYNIPVIDVGGYPVNLSYQSGTNMEDEASWVGAGWTLNPGAINRNMRGLPDEFDGSKGDKIEKEYSRKPFKKAGGQVVLKPSILGWEKGNNNSYKINVYKDNYYGIGASVGASLGFNLAKNQAGTLTAGLNLDINSDVRDGVNITPSLALKKSYDMLEDESTKANLSGGFTYNTRSGLKNITLGTSYNTAKYANNLPPNIDKSAVKYFGQSYTPQINTNTKNSGFTFSFDFGPSFFGIYGGTGGSGYFYKEENLEPTVSVPAFGYMNYAKGRKNEGALLDFNREKDGVFLVSAPAIPVPVATHDLFVASGQTGSQQFRPYFGGNYVVFDRIHTNINNNTSLGLTIGGGNLHKFGGRIDLTNGGSTTKKWTANNTYLDAAEAPLVNTIDAEPVYLKQVGEVTKTDNAFYDKFGNTQTGKVALQGRVATTSLKTRDLPVSLPSITKEKREKRNYGLSYLTTAQAKRYALDKKISGMDRDADPYRLPHHISNMTVTDNEGKRMEYGIAVYNTYQEEVTFSVNKPTAVATLAKARRTGIISYVSNDASPFNKNGRDWLYTKEKTPGYATSYLLTAVLSPDYVDVTGDGVTDDDLGTAVKFNYTRLTASNTPYQWRSPYQQNSANYNEGFYNDRKDDKASYVYGKKEIWYLQSIESKTMIAFFETSNREDGLGVLANTGGKNDQLKLKKLDRIKLYSKADLVKNPTGATPVKVVHLEYDYSLYKGVPNNSGLAVDKAGTVLTAPLDIADPNKNVNINAGKLTLKRMYATFGNNNRGMSNPYEFTYDMLPVNDGTNSNLPQPVPTTADPSDPLKLEKDEQYSERQGDRWGSYKPGWYNHLMGTGNTSSTVNNSEYPYSLQKNSAPAGVTTAQWGQFIDRLASKWQLTRIVTPSSGIITIDYESDDYAYVQNRKAMQMCFIKGVDVLPPANQTIIPGFINKNKSGVKKLVIDLPEAVTDITDFTKKYMTNADGRVENRLFYKILTDLTFHDIFEYVHGYAEINWGASTASGNTAYIAINKTGEYNPVVKSAWQMMRTDLPQFAYDGYDNSDATDLEGDLSAITRSLVAAVRNLDEITKPFDVKADARFYADRIDITKSMVRLNTPPKLDPVLNASKIGKTGGGVRVKKVQITDEWQAMANTTGANTVKYGQVYDYTIKNKDGSYISSGVASYEPAIGNEENPFHEPINFTEKVRWTSDKYHYIEKPFCETYFPAASVGYSKVTVTAFGDDYAGGQIVNKHTGYIENEFYTAKDFPTLVDYLPLDQYNTENSLTIKLFSSTSVKRVATSQGFKIELNDMHGKPKSAKIFNKGGDLISSTEYFYRVKDKDAEVKELDNDNIDLLDYSTTNDGTITKGTVGTDIDFTSDVRESVNESVGKSTGAYLGSMVFGIFGPFPYVAVNRDKSITIDSYNSVCDVKVINRFGIVSKVITTQNGSTIEAENLLWDALTGEVLLTRTQNEFDKSTYAFNYPAGMVNEYEGMGAAYKNLGITFTNFVTGVDGIITSMSSTDQSKYLFPGDELVNLGSTEQKGWIIKSLGDVYRLIDEKGDFIQTSGSWLLLRSGRRNMLAAGVGSVITMKDPRDLTTNKIVLDVDKKVLDAKSIEFKEEWAVPVNNIYNPGTENETLPYCENFFIRDLIYLYLRIPQAVSPDPAPIRERLFAGGGSPEIVHDLFTAFEPAPFSYVFTGASDPDTRTFYGESLYSIGYSVDNPRFEWRSGKKYYYFNEGDLATIGAYKLRFENVTQSFNDLINFITPPNTNTSLNPPGSPFTITLSNTETECNIYIRLIHPDLSSSEIVKIVLFKPVSRPETSCLNPIGQSINPFYKGVLGNWRPLMNYVYTVARDQKPGNINQPGGTDIRNSGAYTTYAPFWIWQSNKLQKSFSPAEVLPLSDPRSRWVWSNKSIYFDQKGNEVESVDALNRYGAALFGYQQSAATAVGANARHNEIAFDGFEDYDFDLVTNPNVNCPLQRHLDWNFVKTSNTFTSYDDNDAITGTITPSVSHTGKYSYAITGHVTLTKGAGNASPTGPVLGIDNVTGKQKLLANELAAGFAPIASKKYILSMWVNDADNDNAPANNTIQGLQVKVNNVDQQVSTKIVPVVEGWKRLELSFTAGSQFTLELIPSGTIYIDDVRMLPSDGQMNSYVYDDRTMRLVAQLDENNFATLYEYDDEGTPIRVKKETEKGIMTLKENRQSLRKRN